VASAKYQRTWRACSGAQLARRSTQQHASAPYGGGIARVSSATSAAALALAYAQASAESGVMWQQRRRHRVAASLNNVVSSGMAKTSISSGSVAACMMS